MSGSQVIIAGSEAGAYEKATGALRQAIEACRLGNVPKVCDGLRRCVEGCSEVGLYTSGGNWGIMASMIEQARGKIALLQPAQLKEAGERIAQQLERILGQVRALRVNAASKSPAVIGPDGRPVSMSSLSIH